MREFNIVTSINPKGIYITGSDTEIGKTFVACAIVREIKKTYTKVGVYKPLASGVTDLGSSDAYQLWSAAELSEVDLNRVCPQSFSAPIAPVLAAASQNGTVDTEVILAGFHYWTSCSQFVVVEGAGGFLSPMTKQMNNADLAKRLQLPIVVVVPNRLGCVNQAMLVLEVARARDISVTAVVLNQHCLASNDSSINSNQSLLRETMDLNGFQEVSLHHFEYKQSHLSL